MQRYAVEVYSPRGGSDEFRAAAARLRRAARALTREGTPITYRRSLFLPTDETSFHIVDGISHDAVAEATRRAALGTARIVEARQ
ncbi:MAG: hypothetical protein WAQ33_00930 [Gaiellaceae bacterium]